MTILYRILTSMYRPGAILYRILKEKNFKPYAGRIPNNEERGCSDDNDGAKDIEGNERIDSGDEVGEIGGDGLGSGDDDSSDNARDGFNYNKFVSNNDAKSARLGSWDSEASGDGEQDADAARFSADGDERSLGGGDESGGEVNRNIDGIESDQQHEESRDSGSYETTSESFESDHFASEENAKSAESDATETEVSLSGKPDIDLMVLSVRPALLGVYTIY